MTAIRAIVSDLDGVIRQFPRSRDAALERSHRIPVGTLARTAFAPERLVPAITGRITDEDWRRSIRTALAAAYPDADTAEAEHQWSAFPGEVDHDVLRLLSLPGVPVALCTNATTRLEADLATLGLSGTFAFVVSSAALGVAKPRPEVFRAVVERAGMAPSEVLFVDDTAANVEAARAYGLVGYHFVDAADLSTLLATLSFAAR